MTRIQSALFFTTGLLVAGTAGLLVSGCSQSSRAPAPFFTGNQPNPDAPTITGVAPSSGLRTGGTSVTVTGTRFEQGMVVRFGGRDATVVSVTETSAQVTTPAADQTGPVDVFVSTTRGSAQLAGAFTYQGMRVTGVSPSSGSAGQGVVITGENFVNVTSVQPLATFTVSSPTTITGTLASGFTGPTDVVVVSSSLGTASLPGAFSFPTPPGPPPPLPPSINSISPGSSSPGATSVTITGNFPAGVTGVTINGTPLASFGPAGSATTSITGTTPVLPVGGPYDVVVTQVGGAQLTLSGAFTVTGVQIQSLSPGQANRNTATPITITGAGFGPSSNPGTVTVSFGGTAGTITGPITEAAGVATIPVNTPTGVPTGTVSVTVSTTNNGSAAFSGFVFFDNTQPPIVTSVSPDFGPESGGTQITISGQNFTTATTAVISSPVLSFVVVNDSTITATTAPLDSATFADIPTRVTVTSPAGTSTQDVLFTYRSSLFIDEITPNNGPIAGGNTVKIRGRRFQTAGNNVTGVKIGGKTAAFQILGPTELTAVVPAGERESVVSVELVGTLTVGGALKEFSYTYGPLLDDPSLPNNDPFDTPGDVWSQQTGFAEMASITSAAGAPPALGARVAAGDFTSGNFELVGVTLPGSTNVRLFTFTVIESLSGSRISITRTAGHTAAAGLVDVGFTPADVVWTDVNSDGNPDLAVLGTGGQVAVVRVDTIVPLTTTLLAGVADGSGAAGTASSITTGDFNGDGFFDVATSRGPSVVLFYNSGAGALQAAVAADRIDLSGAGITQVVKVIAAEPNGPSLLGLTPGQNTIQINRLPTQLRRDMNRDGRTDLVALRDDGSIVTLYGPGTSGAGGFTTSTVTAAGLNAPVDFILTDFNGDQRLDPAVLTQTSVGVFQGSVSAVTGLGSVAQIGTLTFPTGGTTTPTAITSGDFNFDCRQDLVISNFNGEDLVVYLSQGGNGAFDAPIPYKGQVAVNLTGTVLIDLALSARGNLWAVAHHTTNNNAKALIEVDRHQLSVFTGNCPEVLTGKTVAGEAGAIITGADPRAITMADMDDNGTNDVVIANFGAASIEVRLGDGEGNILQTFTVGTQAGPHALAVGDVNRDGRLDVVVANHLGPSAPTDGVTIHLGLGNGSLGAGIALAINGRSPRDVAVADVDNDGRLDILTCNQDTNDVSVLRQSVGPMQFGAAERFGVGNKPVAFAVVDLGLPETTPGAGTNPSNRLTADGILDVVTANSVDDTLTVLYGSIPGAGLFALGSGETYPLNSALVPNRLSFNLGVAPSAPDLFRGTVEPVDVGAADMNQDGALDLVVVEAKTETVTILHGNRADRLFAPIDPSTLASRDRYVHFPTTGDGANVYRDESYNTGTGTPEFVAPNLSGVNFSTSRRKWFLPSDYRYGEDAKDIGRPRITLPVGTNPQHLQIADTNVDGRPDLVVGNFGGTLTIYINADADTQSGSKGPAEAFTPLSDPPADPPFFSEVLPGVHTTGAAGIGETTFRSPRIPFPFDATNVPGYSTMSFSPTFFTVTVGGSVTGIATERFNRDCPPDTAVIRADNRLVIMRGE